jgi:hypothetical protein
VSPKLALYSMIILTAFVLVSLAIAFLNPLPLHFFYPGVLLANISGYIALFLVAATGVLMLFRKPMLRMTRSPDALREVHVVLAALGGLFIIIHVAFLLFFPISLPVLFGYLGTYVAFVVWVTGVIFIEGFRSSLFYHGLLSLVGLSLIVIHVFGAGRSVPIFISGIALVAIAVVVIFGALKQLAELPPESA